MLIKLVLQKKFHILPPVLLGVIVMLFFRDYVGIAIPPVTFLLLTTLVMVLGDKNDIITMCICLIPMLNAFQTKYALMIAMIVYMLKYGRWSTVLKVNKSIWTIAVLFFWEILHGLLGTFAPIEIIRAFVEIFFCFFIISVSYKDINYNSMARAFAFTSVAICSIILLMQLKQTGYQVNLLFSGIYRFGNGIKMDELSVGFNPNILSFICLSSIECLCIINYKKESTFTDVAMIVLLTIFGLLTMSKKFIVCGALFALAFILVQKNPGKKLKYFLLVFILAIITFVIISKAFPSVITMVISRFKVDDISTGRNDIMAFYNSQIASNPSLAWFGVGYCNYAEKLNNLFPGKSIPHNGFQELIIMWGIPGLVVFTCFLKDMVISAKHNNTGCKMVSFLPFLILIIFCLAAQMVSSTVIVMLMAVSYLCMCENTEIRLSTKE